MIVESWLQAIRDHPERPPAAQRHVLTMLALRMDFETGRGFASTGQLMADADASETIIRRATAWAQKAGLLVQVRRGGRRGDGTVRANEWRIVTGRSQISTGHQEISTGPPRPVERPQPVAGDVLRGSQPVAGGVPSSLLKKLSLVAIAEVQRLTGRDITRADAERMVKLKLEGKSFNYPERYLKKIIGDDPRWWLPTPQPPPYRKDNRDDAADPFGMPE